VLSDKQFIDQIRAELHAGMEVLKPSQELLEAVDELAHQNGRSPNGSAERPTRRDRRWRGRVSGLGAAVPVLAAVIVVVVVAAVALTSLRPHHSSTPAGAGIATHNGKIAFISGWSLEFANPDGSGVRHVGAVPHQCDVPGYSRGVGCFAWSPNGKQLAYLAGGSHKLTLYLVSADGQHPRRLTACGDCRGVTWSPDGTQIAVGRYVAGQVNVWVVNAKTGATRRITDCQPNSATCAAAGHIGTQDPAGYTFQLQWSPNGQKIFFIRFGVPTGGATAVGSLGTVRPDGSDLTDPQIPDPETAFWSPDGRELAVIQGDQGASRGSGVYIVDTAGTAREVARLWRPAGIAWSPDGRELAIAAAGGIYTIDSDGRALTRVAGPSQGGVILRPSQSRLPGFLDGETTAWSPNGKELAYGGDDINVNAEEVWTSNADGSDRRMIFKTGPVCCGPSPAAVPIWSPDGRQLAFSSIAGTYMAKADGSDLHRIGQGAGGAFAWQPVPSTR
jgi:Tol biopolymer transport system component